MGALIRNLCIQVIVQARLGEKVNTRSGSTPSRSDWFNLSVVDKAGVQVEARKQLNKHLPEIDKPLCIEISLKTAEGDSMILETWKIVMTEKSDPGVRIHYKVYNRMSLLLKSLICLTRTTPAYRVSRHQSPEDYKIFYRIYFGENNTSLLGEASGLKFCNMMHVPRYKLECPINPGYSNFLSWWTVPVSSGLTCVLPILISLQRSNSNPMKVSDDHYGSPKSTTECQPCTSNKNRSGEGTMHTDSYSDYITVFSTSPPDKAMYDRYDISQTPVTHQFAIAGQSETHENAFEGQRNHSFSSLSGDHKLGAFASMNQSPQLSDNQVDIPFVSLLSDTCPTGSPKHKSVVVNTQKDMVDGPSSTSTLQKSSESQHSDVEDFVMVDLKLAFAQSDPCNDFSSFYRDLQYAPNLEMFHNSPSLSQTLGEVPDQLAKYEANASDIDEFVETLLRTKEENDL
ncbi:autophagy-related protein 13-like [Anneissia japonica]|uniref:autophagy-related protein 13-like n=1 Tax=Anneissia japonica TaxID=1529436 RepID=UPI0014255703|nr:autophagy-related protein 13-like [Anneissia japonica]